MTKEDIIKYQIEAQYKTVANFCDKTGIPDSTVRNIFKRGFGGIGVTTGIKICRALHLDIEVLMMDRMEIRPNEQKQEVLNAYRRNPIDLDSLTDLDLELLELIRQLPEDQKTLLRSLLQGIAPPPS